MHASMGKLRDDMAVLVLGPDPSAAAAGVMLPGPAEGQEPIKESDG